MVWKSTPPPSERWSSRLMCKRNGLWSAKMVPEKLMVRKHFFGWIGLQNHRPFKVPFGRLWKEEEALDQGIFFKDLRSWTDLIPVALFLLFLWWDMTFTTDRIVVSCVIEHRISSLFFLTQSLRHFVCPFLLAFGPFFFDFFRSFHLGSKCWYSFLSSKKNVFCQQVFQLKCFWILKRPGPKNEFQRLRCRGLSLPKTST